MVFLFLFLLKLWRRRRVWGLNKLTEQDQVSSLSASEFRRGVYERLLTKIRLVVITRMAKPEEVLIVEDENGEWCDTGTAAAAAAVEFLLLLLLCVVVLS